MLNYTNPSYDFYTVIAPTDPRLPGGGGYRILGLNDRTATLPTGQPTAQTYMDDAELSRGTASTRTSSGVARRVFACRAAPAPAARSANTCDRRAGCARTFAAVKVPSTRRAADSCTPCQTSVRGSVSYTVPEGRRAGEHASSSRCPAPTFGEPDLQQGPGQWNAGERGARDASVRGRHEWRRLLQLRHGADDGQRAADAEQRDCSANA